MNISSTDIIYTAGLVDGEGTITLMRCGPKQKRSPVISISSTTFELVDFMKQTFGGNIITLKKTKHKQAYHWQMSHTKALTVMTMILPYLKEPEKKRRAQLLVSTYQSVTPRNGKYTEDMLKAKERFETEFFTLPSSMSTAHYILHETHVDHHS